MTFTATQTNNTHDGRLNRSSKPDNAVDFAALHQQDPLFTPPRVPESSFETVVGELDLPDEILITVVALHNSYVSLAAYQRAAYAIGEILRRASDLSDVGAVIARELGIIDETMPEIAARFGRTKQAIDQWKVKVQMRFDGLRRPKSPVGIPPAHGYCNWAQVIIETKLPRKLLERLRRDGELRSRRGKDGVSHWYARTTVERIRRRAAAGEWGDQAGRFYKRPHWPGPNVKDVNVNTPKCKNVKGVKSVKGVKTLGPSFLQLPK